MNVTYRLKHHSKLFLSAETAEIHPTIILHGCRENTDPFDHRVVSITATIFLQCHKHCPQRGCQADLEQEEVRPYHSCVEGPTPLASHPRIDFKIAAFVHKAIHSRGPTYFSSTCNPVREVGARAHLRSAVRGDLTVPRSKTCCFGPRSLCLRTGCLELTARGHSNSGTVAGTFQIYVENTFISPSICIAALTELLWLG